MTKRKPTITAQHCTASQVELTLHVEADILDFQGHFPQHPLLPGVTQIDWAIYYGHKLLNTYPHFAGMEVIKFQEPILPGSNITLTLEWFADKHKLHFAYTSTKGTHSSGRIKLDTNV